MGAPTPSSPLSSASGWWIIATIGARTWASPAVVDRPEDQPVEDQRRVGRDRVERADAIRHVGGRRVGEAAPAAADVPDLAAGGAQLLEQTAFVDEAAGERADVAGDGEGGGRQLPVIAICSLRIDREDRAAPSRPPRRSPRRRAAPRRPPRSTACRSPKATPTAPSARRCPCPVASHSTTVTARTAAGTAIRAAAKNAGSMAGSARAEQRARRPGGVALEHLDHLPRRLPRPCRQATKVGKNTMSATRAMVPSGAAAEQQRRPAARW